LSRQSEMSTVGPSWGVLQLPGNGVEV